MSVDATRKKVREKDIEIIFKDCPQKSFATALEVGAGDGFQSQLLSKYITRLVCTEKEDFRFDNNANIAGIEYRKIDAHEVAKVFGDQQFDLIFSSNVLEHLERVDLALAGFRDVLKDDGVMIHVMPNRLWVLLRILLVVPAYFFHATRKLLFWQNNHPDSSGQQSAQRPVSPKRLSSLVARVYRKIWPLPHGVSRSNFEEFYCFGKNNWQKCFDENGLRVYKIINLQFHSPHRFGIKGLRQSLTRLDLCTTYAYIVAKKSCQNHFLKYF